MTRIMTTPSRKLAREAVATLLVASRRPLDNVKLQKYVSNVFILIIKEHHSALLVLNEVAYGNREYGGDGADDDALDLHERQVCLVYTELG